MKKRILRLGYYSAVAALVAAFCYSIAQLLQSVGVIDFPVADILIYAFSLCIATPFLLAMVALHYSVEVEKRIWTHIAILFAVMYTLYVTMNYFVQLAVVIPTTLRGEGDAVRLLACTEHSLFWTMDGLGYLCMGIATFSAAFALEKGGPQRWLRIFLLANGLMDPILAFIYFYPHFSTGLLLIGTPWVITACGSLLLLAKYFRRVNSQVFILSPEPKARFGSRVFASLRGRKGWSEKPFIRHLGREKK